MRRRKAGVLLLIGMLTLGACGTATPAAPPTIALPTSAPPILPTLTWTPPTRPPALPLTPQRVLSPTPTPPPSTPAFPYGWVRPREANLRARPSLDAPTLGRVPGGTTLRLLGRTEDARWFYVETRPLQGEAQRGWMAATVVTTFANMDRIPVVSTSP